MTDNIIKINLGNDEFKVDLLDLGDLTDELIDKFNNIADDVVNEYGSGDHQLIDEEEIQCQLERMVFHLMVNSAFYGKEKTTEVIQEEVNWFISDRIDQDEWVSEEDEEIFND